MFGIISGNREDDSMNKSTIPFFFLDFLFVNTAITVAKIAAIVAAMRLSEKLVIIDLIADLSVVNNST